MRLYSSRAAAHDWLVGMSGSWRESIRAIRAANEPEIEIVVTRPTAPHLPETIELAARIGVKRATIRMPRWSEFDGCDAVTLHARLPLTAPHLAAAIRVANELGLELTIADFPTCVVPSSITTRDEPMRCARCPGASACSGVSREYVSLFGWNDLDTHLIRRAPESIPDSILVQFDEQTSSRVLRQRLVRAAQEGAPLLRIASRHTFTRGDSPDLLRDAGLLSFERVELAGDARGLGSFSDGQIARLQFASRIDALVSDDTEGEVPGILRRVTEISGVPTFCFTTRSNNPRTEWLWSDRRCTTFTRDEYDPIL